MRDMEGKKVWEDGLVWFFLLRGLRVGRTGSGSGRKGNVVLDPSERSPVKADSRNLIPRKEIMDEDVEEVTSLPTKKKRKIEEEDLSDSDMSILIDSTPPKSKSSKPGKQPKQTSSKPNTTKPSKPPKPTNPTSTETEIKHLKSLIFKCGLRKNWSLHNLPLPLSTPFPPLCSSPSPRLRLTTGPKNFPPR